MNAKRFAATSARFRTTYKEYIDDLRRALPDGWEIEHAFLDADDDGDFDSDPGANYLIGLLCGAADALDMSVFELIDEIEKGETDHARS